MKFTKGSMVRFTVLILAILNQWLSDNGITPIPVDEDSINTLFTTGIALYVAYKDNPVTHEGKKANQDMKKAKALKKIDGSQQMNGQGLPKN